MELKYKFHQTIIDGDPCYINNINIWDYSWNPTGEVTQVIDPLYANPLDFSVYNISDGMNNIQFAAGEFSDNIWGIYCLNTAEG